VLEHLRRRHPQARHTRIDQTGVGTAVVDHRDPLPDDLFQLVEEEERIGLGKLAAGVDVGALCSARSSTTWRSSSRS
jgi:hypothetical protein